MPWVAARAQSLPWLLAFLLQVVPLARSIPALASLGSGVAILLRWVGSTALLTGAFHSVSAASASISGLTQYQNSRPIGKAVTNVTTQVGTPFNYRITVLNPGGDHQGDYFNCIPIPPGLTLNTNVGGTGFITGTPTTAGTYNVRLYAGHTAHPVPVFLDVRIQVDAVPQAPSITTQPANRSVVAGGTATFSVIAAGTAPITYQWLRDGSALAGATNATLELSNVMPSLQGQYWVVVSNALGSATSNKATLIVQETFSITPKLDQWAVVDGRMQVRVSGAAGLTHVLWSSSDLRQWVAVETNTLPTGIWLYTSPTPATAPQSFLRAAVIP